MNDVKELYFVAVKILLRKGDELLLTHDVFGDWDIPGGRIKPDEFEVSLEDIIARKMQEELGGAVQYELGEPKIFFRHKRIEHSTQLEARIFAVGYEAVYKSGEISLGSNHDRYEWMDIKTFDPSEYLKGGWLKGMTDYIQSIRGKL